MLGGAVVVKLLHDAPEIAGRWIARDETLNKLPTNKGADTLVAEDAVERLLEILQAVGVESGLCGIGLAPGRGRCGQAVALRGGQDHIIEDALGAEFMAQWHQHHRVHEVRRRVEIARQAGANEGLVVVPAGEDAGKPIDHFLVVRGHEVALGIQDEGPVRPEAVQA